MKVYRGSLVSVLRFIVLSLVLLQSALNVPAQRPIVITADQPNVWTLEQAHYLLAQLHRRNLDLRAKALDDLDANAINGVNIEMVKTLLEASAAFDQGKGFNNKQLKDQKEFEATRRQQLMARRSELQDQSLQLTRQIAELEIKKLQTKDETEKENIQAQIDQLKVVQEAVKEQISQTNTELGTLNAPSGDFGSATLPQGGFDQTKFANSLDSLFATTAKTIADNFNKTTPQLNATLQLDNYLQMQYEILSKQLTLLRDEVGPGERLLFLELPQSINATHDKADKRWAQSWWKIRGFTCMGENEKCDTSPSEQSRSGDYNSRPETTLQKMTVTENGKIFRDLDNMPVSINLTGKAAYLEPLLKQNNRVVRVVDLFPRQSSLNVNTLKTKSNAFSLKLLFSFLSGFGASGNFQKQREQLSQFVQQELYSSAFGKGSREFGWTFNPMPGTKRLMSGVRTTYAVVIVPREAKELVVESTGCYFKRYLEQPENFDDATGTWRDRDISRQACFPQKAFYLSVPDSGYESDRGFWVESLFYRPVKKGERIVVSINGRDFSSQTGVLVNGIALPQALGLAQLFILDDSVAGGKVRENIKDEKIRGGFERVGSEQIVAAFTMPDGYEGTPTITLVAPGKAIDLNRLSLSRINNVVPTAAEPKVTLDAQPYMFGKRIGPNPSAIKIDKINVFQISGGQLNAVITGENFRTIPAPPAPPGPGNPRITDININGVDCNAANNCSYTLTQTLIRVSFDPPQENSVYFTLLSEQETLKAEPVDNPAIDTPPTTITTNSALLRVERVKFLSSDSGIVVVQLIGSGFTDKLKVDKGDLIVTSPTRAMLKIDRSILPEVVTLTNEQLKIQAKAVITGKPPERAQ